jgi:hypothetical protein
MNNIDKLINYVNVCSDINIIDKNNIIGRLKKIQSLHTKEIEEAYNYGHDHGWNKISRSEGRDKYLQSKKEVTQ